jgi:hypothetical protein
MTFVRSRLVIQLFYAISALLLGYTLIAQVLLTHHQGRSLANTFSYFTIQSNVLVLVTSAVIAVKPDVSGAWWRALRLAALCGITTTGIVYASVIAPYVHLSGWSLFYDYVFHYVMPIAMVVGFFFVGPRLRFVNRDLAYLAWPIAWLLYTMLRGAFVKPEFMGFGEAPSHYPYRFLDVDREGVGQVVGACVIIAIALIGLGIAYIRVEGRLEKRNDRTAGATLEGPLRTEV